MKRQHSVLVSLGLLFVLLLNACGSTGPAAPSKTEVVSYTFSPASSATLKMGQRVNADLSFTSTSSAGVRIWAIPVDDAGDKVGAYCASQVITAKQGIAGRCILIDGASEPVNVRKIRLVIKNPDQSQTFYDQTVDVDYTWVP